MATNEDLYYENVLRLVLEAGGIVREAFNRPGPVNFTTKSSDIDLVTETDKRVEDHLINGLKAKFPDHKFIGEESDKGKNVLTAAPTWIIDPVDGTTNFVHKFPFVCISIGCYIERKARIGIIYNPMFNDLYTARAGQGAYKNGFRIHCSGTKELAKSVVLSTVGAANDRPIITNFLESMKAFLEAGIRGHRSLGSAAMNMVYVASGCADAYVEYGIHCWDMAAAGLIIQEAGGVMIDPSGSDFDLMSRRVLCASTKELALEISTLMTHVKVPRDD